MADRLLHYIGWQKQETAILARWGTSQATAIGR
jgi:hypothetical protein